MTPLWAIGGPDSKLLFSYCCGVVMHPQNPAFCIRSWALLSLLALHASCRPASEIKNQRLGVPGQVVPGSFKLNLSAEGENLPAVQASLKEIAQRFDCGYQSLEAIRWQSGLVSSELAQSYHLMLSSCSQSSEQLSKTLQAISEIDSVQSVEAEATANINLAENDPLKSRQYHLPKIRRDEACTAADSSKAKTVLVAVVDSGVEASHSDLKDAFYRDANGQVVGANFVGKGASASPDRNWSDQNDHGTHVAGLIAATHQNQEGIVGVASCAKVKILPIRVMDANGQGSSIEIERGVQWAAAQGADIINLSLGSNSRFAGPRSSFPSPLYQDLSKRGILVFAAAGNDGLTLGRAGGNVYSFPASYEGVISVAASDETDELASFSNRGETVDIAAPGARDLSTYLGEGYRALSGTSMASPVAAGAYALALSLTRSSPQQRFAYEDIRSLLRTSVRTQNLRGEVDSAGVLDSRLLVENLAKLQKPESVSPRPEAPAPAPSSPKVDTDFAFVGLSSGQTVLRPIQIKLTAWPKVQTARIYLYWVTAEDPTPYAFKSLDRRNLDSSGQYVVDDQSYYVYGEGFLVAEAVDSSGESLQTIKIGLRGR